MILITGATGTVGRHLVRRLAQAGQPVRAMTRDLSRAGFGPGVTGVQADFDDPSTLAHAVAGVDTVFLLTAPDVADARPDKALIAAARAAGVRTVVRLSAIGTGEQFDGHVIGRWHLDADNAVRDSGLQWTVLRPTTFDSNCLSWVDGIAAGAAIPNIMGDAEQAVIDPRDIAEVAAAVLMSPQPHHGRIYPLTGPLALTVPQQAAVLAELLDRPITTVDVPLPAAREQFLAGGMPADRVEAIITGSGWARAGHNATVTDDVPRLLGRPATDFQTWAREHRDEFERRIQDRVGHSSGSMGR
jgi:uncharacterized protein YbjT (DUF2867 family)